MHEEIKRRLRGAQELWRDLIKHTYGSERKREKDFDWMDNLNKSISSSI